MPQYFDTDRRHGSDARRDALATASLAVVGAPELRTVDDALTWMATELVRRLGFGRAMALRSEEHLLTVTATMFSEQPELAREAQEHAVRHPVELRSESLEVEMMRRGSPALVFPADDRRAWHPIVDQLRTPAYVAAPVRAFGRTAATLHADTYFADREPDADDRTTLGAFAAVCGGLLERAFLFEQIARLRAGARAHAEGLLALAGTDGATRDLGAGPAPPGEHVAVGSLTPRENEVLLLMSRGATSQEIARRLVISVGTVKTHARSILRKLGASTRAEAVATALARRHGAH